MQLRVLLLGIILGLSSVTAMAGSGHDHGHGHAHSPAPVDQATAKTNASKIVAAFVKRNELDKSWASIAASSVEKKLSNGNAKWVVVFVNKNITDTDKQKFYVFLTLGGDYVATNYTGK